MDLLAPFLYQFIVGGAVLLAGLYGAARSGALDFSSKRDRVWTAAIFTIVSAYFIVQAAFQFLFTTS